MKTILEQSKEEKSKLEEAYTRMSNALSETSFFVFNAVDKIGKHIEVTIMGNIDDFNFEKFGIKNIVDSNFHVVERKTKIKKNLRSLTFYILKKDLETEVKGHKVLAVRQKQKEKMITEQSNIIFNRLVSAGIIRDEDKKELSSNNNNKEDEEPKDIKSLFEGISVFKNKYDDGHNHEFNKDGYCYYCGVQKRDLEEFNVKRRRQLSDKEKDQLEKCFSELGNYLTEKRWKDLDSGEMLYHHRGVLINLIAIVEGLKGTIHQIEYDVKEGYLMEKIESLKRDIQEICRGQY